jgi:hypothetical protein
MIDVWFPLLMIGLSVLTIICAAHLAMRIWIASSCIKQRRLSPELVVSTAMLAREIGQLKDLVQSK